MKSLVVSISGVRGIVGEGLTPDILSKLASSFGTILHGGKVAVATDSRVSREMCLDAVMSGLLSTGCEVISLGICPTPSLQIMISELNACGGICITASHNPPEWNGLKFYTEKGILLGPAQAKKLLSVFSKSKMSYMPSGKLGSSRREEREKVSFTYRLAVLRILDVKLIRRRKFKVVIDCGDGAGSVSAPAFLKDLGCEVTMLNCRLDGFFNRLPEPVPQNLAGLCSLVRKKKAAIGFAQDADADRLAIVSEDGKCLGEDSSLALAVEFILSHNPGPVVTNLSTTRAVEEIAGKFGCPFFQTRVGEINVVEMMKEKKAVVGGEGNGGVILPSVHYGRDSLVGMGLVLQYMAEEKKSISELASSIPHYAIIKRKVSIRGVSTDAVLKKVCSSLKGAKFDLTDGVKAIWENSWILVRPSGTEPVLRIVAEARTKSEAMRLYKRVKKGTDTFLQK